MNMDESQNKQKTKQKMLRKRRPTQTTYFMILFMLNSRKVKITVTEKGPRARSVDLRQRDMRKHFCQNVLLK